MYSFIWKQLFFKNVFILQHCAELCQHWFLILRWRLVVCRLKLIHSGFQVIHLLQLQFSLSWLHFFSFLNWLRHKFSDFWWISEWTPALKLFWVSLHLTCHKTEKFIKCSSSLCPLLYIYGCDLSLPACTLIFRTYSFTLKKRKHTIKNRWFWQFSFFFYRYFNIIIKGNS